MKNIYWILLTGVFLVLFSCGKKQEGGKKMTESTNLTEAAEPDHIEVQHILISFNGAPRMTGITRSQEEAKKLAYEVFESAKSSENFDELVKVHTNDSFPGRYKMANNGVQADQGNSEYPRSGMVAAFGDVGFKPKVGEIGISDHDAQKSPFGWHIIKRV